MRGRREKRNKYDASATNLMSLRRILSHGVNVKQAESLAVETSSSKIILIHRLTMRNGFEFNAKLI
jgi:hypothetical protein